MAKEYNKLIVSALASRVACAWSKRHKRGSKNEQEYEDYKRHEKQYSYRNGKLALYQEMANGKEHGITRLYDEYDHITEEVLYEHGKEVSRNKFKK